MAHEDKIAKLFQDATQYAENVELLDSEIFTVAGHVIPVVIYSTTYNLTAREGIMTSYHLAVGTPDNNTSMSTNVVVATEFKDAEDA